MNDILGHCDREKRIILVKKRVPRRAWTNRTTILSQKFCKKHNKICEFSGEHCKLKRQEDYKKRKNNKST